MTDSQTIWAILWDHARAENGPFEINDVVPSVARAIGQPEKAASHAIASLIEELDRLPEGEQYFDLEGNAAVPLPEFFAAREAGEEGGRGVSL